jgi:hypothetical protein
MVGACSVATCTLPVAAGTRNVDEEKEGEGEVPAATDGSGDGTGWLWTVCRWCRTGWKSLGREQKRGKVRERSALDAAGETLPFPPSTQVPA